MFQCKICNARKEACGVCLKGYCKKCDKTAFHDNGVPYFNDNTLEGFKKCKRLMFTSLTCCSPGCTSSVLYKCSKGNCCGLFCEKHVNHMHFGCFYKNCHNRAITYTQDWCEMGPNKWFCHYHYNVCNNATLSSGEKSVSSYALCGDCRKPLIGNCVYVGLCINCNGKWQDLKSKGIKGIFG